VTSRILCDFSNIVTSMNSPSSSAYILVASVAQARIQYASVYIREVIATFCYCRVEGVEAWPTVLWPVAFGWDEVRHFIAL
jgi:hypothetical protein